MIKLNHFPKSVIGLVRKANEDSIGSLTNKQTNGNGDIFVVCDGMGGHVGGATASQTAVKCILQYFEQEVNPNPIVALEKAISFANQQIFGLAQQDPNLKGMGTTCTVLLSKEAKIYIAHVGDSRIYINTDNKLYRITKDHSFVQKLVDVGQLEDSEMENHPRKNELTKALGIGANVEVEVAENAILAKSGDKFLMCTDGLCGLVNDLTISNTINHTVGIDCVNELIQLAENAGGNDNISLDLIDIIQSPHSKTIFKDQSNKSLTATQVLDIHSMKGDSKLNTIFKRYQAYILSSLLVLVLVSGYFIYPLIKGNSISSQVEDLKKEPIATSVDSSDNSEKVPNKVVKENTTIENTANTSEANIKDGSSAPQYGNTTEKDDQKNNLDRAKKEEEIQKQNSKNLLKKAKDKIDEIKRFSTPENYQNSDPYNDFKREFNFLITFEKDKTYNSIDDQIKKVDKALGKLRDFIARENLKTTITDTLNIVTEQQSDSLKN